MKEKIIDTWYRSFSSCKKLNFNEARELYNKIINTEDETLRKEHMDELILGTLHIIYFMMKRDKTYNLCENTDDVEDLISTYTKKWIEALNNGDLLNSYSFGQMLNHCFASEVCKDIYGKKSELSQTQNKIQFAKLFYEYYKARKNGADLSFDEIYANCIDRNGYQDLYDLLSDFNHSNICDFFDAIYNKLDLDNTEELSESTILKYSHFLLELASNESLGYDFADPIDYEDEAITKMDMEDFVNSIEEYYKDNARNLEMIHSYYNLDGNGEKTFDKVSKEFELSYERTRAIAKLFGIHRMKKNKLRTCQKIFGYKNYS